MPAKQFLEAGKITGVHGIHGDLKVQSWCDSPELLCELETLYLDENTPVKTESARIHKNMVLLHLHGIDTPEQAEALRGRILFLNRHDVKLPDDLVFIQDIIGFAVADQRTGETIGILHDVLTTNPAQDLYEIMREDGRCVYIPAVKPFLQGIDMDAGIIRIESIEGLV